MEGYDRMLRRLSDAAFQLRWDVFMGVPERNWMRFCAAYEALKASLPDDRRLHFLLHVAGVHAYDLRFDPSQEAWRDFCMAYDALREGIEAWIARRPSPRAG